MQLVERTQAQPLSVSWAEKLIQKMQILYGSKFAQQWEGIRPEIMIAEWSEELAGLTGPEIAKGLDACRIRPWPPTLPEFIALCRPPMNPEVAFHEAIKGLTARRKGERGEWSHPAIYHATIGVGQHDMLNCTYATMRTRWEKALAAQLEKTEWQDIPDANLALPEPRKTELSNQQAQEAMERLGAGGVMNKAGRNHKRWAQKILADQKGRSPTIIAMAKAATTE